VWGGSTCGRERVNEGDQGEGIWLMKCIYLYETEQETSCNCSKSGEEGVEGEKWWGQSNQYTI
jgi:hypothetical protein